MNLAHEILLALAYVSQIRDGVSLRQRFFESLNGLDDAFAFDHCDALPGDLSETRVFPIQTFRSKFGHAVLREGSRLGEEERAIFRNAFLFLATFLENRVQAEALEQDRQKIVREHGELERQLLQSQKLEAVGRLAGGVAHDFNNMLGVISGNVELLLDKLAPGDPMRVELEEVFEAARRSADLTRQLLAFARKQIIQPKVVDLNDTVEGMLKMLRRLIGEDIELSWKPGAGVWSVKVDAAQFDQVLANLFVNARDAIGGVGRINLETSNVSFDAEYCADHADFVEGDFVRLVVSDDGCGMDQETLDKIFEPFFTTKGPGKGTGLGLSVLFGIVRQNEGFVNVYSEPGQGTTFRIYLPRQVEGSKGEELVTSAPSPVARGETVLVVEDEVIVLRFARRVLEKLGYVVLSESDPARALERARSHVGRIHLLITDVVMPGMNGRELAESLSSLHPALAVLYMSGYTADVIAHRGVLDQDVQFLPKPFSNQELAFKVREVLDGGRP